MARTSVPMVFYSQEIKRDYIRENLFALATYNPITETVVITTVAKDATVELTVIEKPVEGTAARIAGLIYEDDDGQGT